LCCAAWSIKLHWRWANRDEFYARGGLVTGFLQGEMSASEYLNALVPLADTYNPFNLLLFDGQRLMCLKSRHKKVLTLQPGIGGASNAAYGTRASSIVELGAQQARFFVQRYGAAGALGATQHIFTLDYRRPGS
jgi:uncharacterized protein with NRDE domain